jgi:hypothetical protein
LGASIERWSAETMPVVTVCSSPNGLPIAITWSPTCILLESPSGIGRSFTLPGSTFSSARSVDGSLPRTFALTRSWSPKRTRTSSAPSTTWALVTM